MSEHPVYETDNSKLPEIEEADLDTAPVGLYRVKGKAKHGDFYVAMTDSFKHDVDQIMLARVDEHDARLPIAVERAEIRADGKRLICQWVEA